MNPPVAIIGNRAEPAADTSDPPRDPEGRGPSPRAQRLADRLERGAAALFTFASTLSAAEWRLLVPKDGRSVGVIVHHVATVYPLDIQLALAVAGGQSITCVTWDVIHGLNAAHAREQAGVAKEATLTLLRDNSNAAHRAIRALTDEQLDRSAVVSLYSDSPLTCQFMLEYHAVRHSVHHLVAIRAVLGR